MTPLQLARLDAINAYEGHDRPAFERALDRMAGCVDLSRMNAEQLLRRQRAITEEAADIADRLAARGVRWTDHIAPLLQAPAVSLDPSDPELP